MKRRISIRFILLSVLFASAILLRVNYLDASDSLGEVQYRAALIARSFYFGLNESIPEWRIQANNNSIEYLPVKEPSITEYFVALVYRLGGKEDIRIARFIVSLFWVSGGLFLYKIVQRHISPGSAVVSLTYYLFVPLGFVVSIRFQPDPLMILMFLVSIYYILQYYQRVNTRKLIFGALISGLSILVKPFILFPIIGAFISLGYQQKRDLKKLVDSNLLIFLSLSLVPSVIYYGYGILVTDTIRGQAELSFLPDLLVTTDYWRRWLLTAEGAVGLTPLIAALLGFALLEDDTYRSLLLGLWAGYIIFCLIFTFHIRFAAYYHLQLIPIIALSLAPLFRVIINAIDQLPGHLYRYLTIVGVAALVFSLNLREIRSSLYSFPSIEPKEIAQEIGEEVNHSSEVVYIASYYGRPLEYYGELSGKYWPRSVSDTDRALGYRNERSVEERLEGIGFIPEYFVITDFKEFNHYHEELEAYLGETCSPLVESDQYMIYGSCNLR